MQEEVEANQRDDAREVAKLEDSIEEMHALFVEKYALDKSSD